MVKHAALHVKFCKYCLQCREASEFFIMTSDNKKPESILLLTIKQA